MRGIGAKAGIGREGGSIVVCRQVRPGSVVFGSECVLLASNLPLALCRPGLLSLACLPDADGCQEGFQMVVEVVRVDAQIPVQEEEELLLHQVDFGDGKAKVVVAANGTVPGPVLVLGRRVVEVLGGEDERGQEDAVDGAAHALCDGRETRFESAQVDERGHEGGDLDM